VDHDTEATAPGVSIRWIAEVVVLPKVGVNDPEGEAILGGLRGLGHELVQHVRAGRLMRVTLAAPSLAAAQADLELMCERLLANPVIERYQVRVHPENEEGGQPVPGRELPPA
jgi:phosphoribosylformylglycinamidine synthase PurS subunit